LNQTKQLVEGIDVMTQINPSEPVPHDLASDRPAITRLKQGNISGLAALVNKYQVIAVHTALLIVRDRNQAEDIAQEAFLQAYRKIDSFDGRRSFRPWFLRIVINAALKSANRQRRSLPLEEPEDGHFATDWLIDPSPGPETLVENAEMRESVWKAIGELTPDQRAAVVMHYFLDRNESEMIQDLNRPLTTIKWWLYAARQRLRNGLLQGNMKEREHQEIDSE
jgi:RNA polymerase sigma-70 factor (ECF subfamily)